MGLTSVVAIAQAITMLGGCAGASANAPVTAANARSDSWVRSDATKGALLYVPDLNENVVNVYTYPAGERVGTLTGFNRPSGICTDAGGDIFVTNGYGSNILEYAHGGTAPIATLSDDPQMFPQSCAVDPSTGNLAIVHSPFGTGPKTVAIFAHAAGSPQALPRSPYVYEAYFVAYDARGNLWVDGMNRERKWFRFAEFDTKKRAWHKATLDKGVALPGSLQWVGNELVVGDQLNLDGPSAIYEFSMKGTAGSLIRTTPLENSCNVLQYEVVGKNAVTANTCKAAVLYFRFPNGGKPIQGIKRGLSNPVGVAISR